MSVNLAEIRSRLAEIDAILASGAKSVTVDNTTTTWDHAALQEERRRLEQQLAGKKKSRPRAYSPRLG